MSVPTHVVVAEGEDWRFDPGPVFDALLPAFPEQPVRQGHDPRELHVGGALPAWEVRISGDGTDVVVTASSPTRMLEVVAWVRRYVPAEVALAVFDEQLACPLTPLPSDATVATLRGFWPDEWLTEREPPPLPSLDEMMRSSKPPHLP